MGVDDIKHIDCQLFLTKMGLFSISRKWQIWECEIMVSHMQLSLWQGEDSIYIKGKKSWESYNKQSPWLFISWVWGRKRSLATSCWTLISSHDMKLPFLVSQLYFNWRVCLLLLLLFYISLFWTRSFSESIAD